MNEFLRKQRPGQVLEYCVSRFQIRGGSARAAAFHYSVNKMTEEKIPLLDEILGDYKSTIGADFVGYRNHVYRMVNFCFAFGDLSADERRKIVIAGCFHDIGIWTKKTFDYLPPSIELAASYLKQNHLESWVSEVEFIIDQHHRLRKISDSSQRLAEVFRKGDLVDFSLGNVKCGLSPNLVREVKGTFPNAGFHKKLVLLAGRWICRHPLDPVPVLKW